MDNPWEEHICLSSSNLVARAVKHRLGMALQAEGRRESRGERSKGGFAEFVFLILRMTVAQTWYQIYDTKSIKRSLLLKLNV